MDSTRVVLIPSYNSGKMLAETVREAVRHWRPVWVVVDGSNDGSAEALEAAPGLRVLRFAQNRGKGAAVLEGLRSAAAAGFTHALVMDADGQHPSDAIADFMTLSAHNPTMMILGVPVFDASAPSVRVLGRRISNLLVRWLTGAEIGDALFGFRVYPIAPLLSLMEASRHMRRYDFDAEAVVRLSWHGVAAVNRAARVRYLRTDEGGVSHFRYGRDNLLLARMYLRLIVTTIGRRVRPSRR